MFRKTKQRIRIVACTIGIGTALAGAMGANAQTLNATTTWLGNTGGSQATHIMQGIGTLYVRPDGTVIGIIGWDEGGANVEMFKNGSLVSIMQDSGTGNYGRMSGLAVAADSTYIYQAMTQGGDDGGTNPPAYPGAGNSWAVVRRYTYDGNRAPFSGGVGWENDSNGNTAGSMLLIASTPTYVSPQAPLGLAVTNGELYVADPNSSTMRVYSTTTMSATPVRSWAILRPGLIAADSANNIWMLQPSDSLHATQIMRMSSTGQTLSQKITFAASVKPTSFTITPDNRILVTDNGTNQNVLIYSNILTNPTLTGTLGTTGGIFSGTAGVFAPLKFNGPQGAGADTAGNIYVASSAVGTALESYTPTGTRNWLLQGLCFVDCPDMDTTGTTNISDIFSVNKRFTMDWSKTAPGSQWAYAATTLNPVKYPNDPRVHTGETSALVRYINGKKFLFMTDQYSTNLAYFRFNSATDGEIAIPSGMFTLGSWTGTWPTNYPAGQEWVWRDANGDGIGQASEYSSATVANPYSWAWAVDSKGGVWKGLRQNGLRYFPCQGLDSIGNPIYSYPTSTLTTNPAAISDIKRMEYDAASDTLYLGGFNAQYPDVDQNGKGTDTWYALGRIVQRYDHWLTGNRTPTYTVPLLWTPNTATDVPKAMATAGNYLFVLMAKQGTIYVYRTSDGSAVGTIVPGPEVAGQSGWADIPIAVRAYAKTSFDYTVIAEEDGFAKNLVYRWNSLKPGTLKTVSTKGKVSLTWTAAPDAQSYRVKRATTSGGPYTLLATTNTLTYDDTTVKAGKTYYYIVTGVNGATETPTNEAQGTGFGRTVSVNFVGGGASLTVSDVAGYLSAGNWNNAVGRYGTLNIGQDTPGQSGGQVSWTSNGTGTASVPDSSADSRLMQGYLDTPYGNTTSIILRNIPFSVYGVTLYTQSNAAGNTGNYTIGSTTVTTSPTTFSGTYAAGDNFVLIPGLTGNTFTLTATPASGPTPRAPINGLQIYETTVAALNFTVQLEGVPDLTATVMPLPPATISLYSPGTQTLIASTTAALLPNPANSAQATISFSEAPVGTVDVRVSVPGFLAEKFPAVTLAADIALDAGTLSGGDATGDNVVDTADFNILAGAYGTTFDPAQDNSITGYDPRADFNFDGTIDTADFNILAGEFGNTGS